MEGAHRIGEEANVGGGGQQTCVAEVTCVKASDWQLEDVHGTCTWMRQLGYWKLRCARVDLGGRGRLDVRLRMLLWRRFDSL